MTSNMVLNMASSNGFQEALDDRAFEGRIIVRRFTDQLTGVNQLERSTQAAQLELDEEEEEIEEQKQLKRLFQDSANVSTSPRDFEVAEIARVTLEGMVNKFIAEHTGKPSGLQRIGINTKSSKDKVTEFLENSVQTDFNELEVSINGLETKWKENHGPIYNSFKKLCDTFDGHKSMFAIFPSQGEYTSVLCGSLSCLVKAARNHSDIAETLSESIASISDKVKRCSDVILIIKTQKLRKLLADIYARMFTFYQDAITWYLSSRMTRLFKSFNENLKKGFESAKSDIDGRITELYRELSVGSTAMITLACQKIDRVHAELRRQRQNYVRQDTTAGRRMVVLLQSSWNDRISSRRPLEPRQPHQPIEPASEVVDVTTLGISREKARTYIVNLERFVVGDVGPGMFSPGESWVAEDDVLTRLQPWMMENESSGTLWISSPYDTEGMTSSRAAALAVVSTAWQAEAPIISHFCRRPLRREVSADLTVSQAGLTGLVYSLITQLLQFNKDEDQLEISEQLLADLNGESQSWDAALEILRALLDHTPLMMYCVIDGLNDLEWSGGQTWCHQLLDVLLARQQRTGTVFNILITTSGQSRALPSRIHIEDRHIASKLSRGVARFGTRVELQPAEFGP